MKTSIRITRAITGLLLALANTTILLSVSKGDVSVYSGEDKGTYRPAEAGKRRYLAELTNSARAFAEFRLNLRGMATESFEGYPTQQATTNKLKAHFGTSEAQITGGTVLRPLPSRGHINGQFAISGEQFLSTTNPITIRFAIPQSAFGFFLTDVENNTRNVVLVDTNGVRRSTVVPATLPQDSGGCIFFGLIDREHPFEEVEISGTGSEGYGFDDMIIEECGSVDVAAVVTVRSSSIGPVVIESTASLSLAWHDRQLINITNDTVWTDPNPIEKAGNGFYRARWSNSFPVLKGFAAIELARVPQGEQVLKGLALSNDKFLFVGTAATIYQIDLKSRNIEHFASLNPAALSGGQLLLTPADSSFGPALIWSDQNLSGDQSCCDGVVGKIDLSTKQMSVLSLGAPGRPSPADSFGLALGVGGEFGDLLYVMDFEGASRSRPLLYTISASLQRQPFAEGLPWTVDTQPAHIELTRGEAFGKFIFVSDVLTRRIWRVSPNGEISAFYDKGDIFIGERVCQGEIRFAKGGAFGDNLYVADTGRLVRISPSGELEVFATGVAPCSIAFSQDGKRCYVATGDTIFEIIDAHEVPLRLDLRLE